MRKRGLSRVSFNNDTSEARYHKQAAELAWARTIAFLKENLNP